MIVTLNAFDLHQCAAVALSRHIIKQDRKVSSIKCDEHMSEFEAHYLGVLGEYAVAKAVGGEVDRDVYEVRDDGVDMEIEGASAQIKTTKFSGRNPFFYVNDMSCFRADVGIGVQIISPCRLKIGGVVSRRKFEKEARLQDLGYGSRLVMSYSEMFPIEDYIEWRSS